MTIDLPITPPIERLLQQQLATGQFEDAADVVTTALRLLNAGAPTPAKKSDGEFGLWKGRYSDGLAYQSQLREEWHR